MLPQITLEIPSEHSTVLSVSAAIEQAVVVDIVPVIPTQLPQLDSTLYWIAEHLESTKVQLKISCSELTPTNWILVGGGRAPIWRN